MWMGDGWMDRWMTQGWVDGYELRLWEQVMDTWMEVDELLNN